MAWEIGPTPDSIAGTVPANDIAEVGPGVSAYGIGASPSHVAGVIVASNIQEVLVDPPDIVEGIGQLVGIGWLSGYAEAITPPSVVEGVGQLLGASWLGGLGWAVAICAGEVWGDGVLSGHGVVVTTEPDVIVGVGGLIGHGYLAGHGITIEPEPNVVIGVGRLIGRGYLAGYGVTIEPEPDVMQGCCEIVLGFNCKLQMNKTLNDTFVITAGDTLPSLMIRALNCDGEPLNLTSYIPQITIVPCPGGRPLINKAALVIVDASQGKMRYDWKAGETSRPGEYLIKVYLFDATNKRMSIPSGGFGKLIITPDA